MSAERERLDADVLIVGAGPAGLACALHLANLIKKHNETNPESRLFPENIYVLEKAREIGAHQLSGAVMDPRGPGRTRAGFREVGAAGCCGDR